MQINRKKLPRFVSLVLSLLLFITPLTGGALAASAPSDSAAPRMLIPGGMPFGVRLQTKGVMVVGLSEVVSGGKTYRPAYDGGVREKDLLVEINGKTVATAEEASAAISAAGANSLTLTVLREGKRHDLRIIPKKCDKDGVFRTGIYLRDSVRASAPSPLLKRKAASSAGSVTACATATPAHSFRSSRARCFPCASRG